MNNKMRNLKIANKLIGEEEPCFIIAEVGVNHNGDLELAKKLINAAKEAGANAVKFQKRELSSLYQEKVLDDPNKSEQAFQYLVPLLKKYEFAEEYKEIVNYCKKKEIIFLCTPFDVPSVDFLEKLDIQAYKTASADLINFPLLEHIINKGKPMLVSTGMSTIEEIDRTVAFLKERKANFILLHCNSTYPAPLEDINLNFIQIMKKKYEMLVGYSGHERGIATSIAAVALGGKVVERHITLDRGMEGPDHRASLEPEEFKTMTTYIREIEKSLGKDKKVFNRGEVLNREVLGKSLVAAKNIKKGEIITKNAITVRSPGKGLSPQKVLELIGKKALRSIKKDELFLYSDLGEEDNLLIEKPFKFNRIWGLKLRLSELDNITAFRPNFRPKLVELHFSDKDLDVPFDKKHYEQYLCIHAPEYWHHQMVDLCSVDEEKRKRSIWVIQKTLRRAGELAPYFKGVPKVVIHVGGMDTDPIVDIKKIKRLMERGYNSFKSLDLKELEILPENLPPRPWYFGGQWYQNLFVSADQMIEFCQTLGLNMAFDTSHAKLYCNLAKEDFLEYVKKVAPLIRHVHFSDAEGINREGLQIGEGEINFNELLDILEGRHWSWIPEIWQGHQQNYKGFLLALNRLSNYENL